MPPKLIALGVIAIVLSIMMMIIAPPQDTTHHSADAGDFASGSRSNSELRQEAMLLAVSRRRSTQTNLCTPTATIM